jgi:hypothetical protein
MSVPPTDRDHQYPYRRHELNTEAQESPIKYGGTTGRSFRLRPSIILSLRDNAVSPLPAVRHILLDHICSPDGTVAAQNPWKRKQIGPTKWLLKRWAIINRPSGTILKDM